MVLVGLPEDDDNELRDDDGDKARRGDEDSTGEVDISKLLKVKAGGR